MFFPKSVASGYCLNRSFRVLRLKM